MSLIWLITYVLLITFIGLSLITRISICSVPAKAYPEILLILEKIYFCLKSNLLWRMKKYKYKVKLSMRTIYVNSSRKIYLACRRKKDDIYLLIKLILSNLFLANKTIIFLLTYCIRGRCGSRCGFLKENK